MSACFSFSQCLRWYPGRRHTMTTTKQLFLFMSIRYTRTTTKQLFLFMSMLGIRHTRTTTKQLFLFMSMLGIRHYLLLEPAATFLSSRTGCDFPEFQIRPRLF